MIKGLGTICLSLAERVAPYASVQDLVRGFPSLEQMRLLVRIEHLLHGEQEGADVGVLASGGTAQAIRPKTLFDTPRPFRLPELDREARKMPRSDQLLGFPLCDFFAL